MVAFIQKAHGCIFVYDAIEAQEAQLAISDSPGFPPLCSSSPWWRDPGGAIAFGCQRCGGGVADVRHLILFCRRGCGGGVGKWQRQCQCPPQDVLSPPSASATDHCRSRHIIPGPPVIAV